MMEQLYTVEEFLEKTSFSGMDVDKKLIYDLINLYISHRERVKTCKNCKNWMANKEWYENKGDDYSECDDSEDNNKYTHYTDTCKQWNK